MRFTINEKCYCGCNSTELEAHEPFCGRNRQLSIKYGMVIAVCRKSHRYIHDHPKCLLDRESRNFVKAYFEEHYPDLNFQKIFM